MNRMEAIQHRRSVRTFDGAGLRPEEAEQLLAFADTQKNPYGLPIRWKLLNAREHGLSSPVIVGAELYIAGKMRRAPHAEEAFGYSFENVVLFAESLGLGTTWIAGTMNREAFERAMELSEDEVMPCVSPVGRPAKRMSLRETMMRKGVKADSRLAFEELFFDGSFDKPLTKAGAGPLYAVLNAVRLAPSAVNKQPWRCLCRDGWVHFYEKRSKGYVSADGWDLQKVDLGIALCHFELAAVECGLKPSFSLRDPALPKLEPLQYIASWRVESPAPGVGRE